MGEIIQSTTAILRDAQRSAETAAHNIANMATPGYRSQVAFSRLLETPQPGAARSEVATVARLTAGTLTETGNALDLAIAGGGFFALIGDDGGVSYTRNGQFSRDDDDGRLLGVGGRAVREAAGGDIVVADGDFSIARDGVITQRDQIVGRLAVVDLDPSMISQGADGMLLAPDEAVTDLGAPVVRQGFLEQSNVSMADEMITLMTAVRRAETGQRVINVYDDLLGRVFTTLGQAAG